MFPQTLGWDELVKCMWGLCLVNLLNYLILLPKFNPEALLGTTHKSSTVVTESGLQVGGLLEVVRKTQAQLGVDGAGPHEVGRDLVSADEAFPASKWEMRCEWGWVTRLLLVLETLFVSFTGSTVCITWQLLPASLLLIRMCELHVNR